MFGTSLRVFFNELIYLFVAVLGLHFERVGSSLLRADFLVAGSGVCSLGTVLFAAVTSLVAEHRPWGTWAQSLQLLVSRAQVQ